MLPIGISESFESNGIESGSGNDNSDANKANKKETKFVDLSGADAAASCKAVRVCSCCRDEKQELQNVTWC